MRISETLEICKFEPLKEVSGWRTGSEKTIFEEIIGENLPILMKTISLQIQEAQRLPSKRFRRSYQGIISITLLKTSDKEEILKAANVNIRNEREDVTTNPTDTKGIIRIYDEQPMSINVKQMN